VIVDVIHEDRHSELGRLLDLIKEPRAGQLHIKSVNDLKGCVMTTVAKVGRIPTMNCFIERGLALKGKWIGVLQNNSRAWIGNVQNNSCIRYWLDDEKSQRSGPWDLWMWCVAIGDVELADILCEESVSPRDDCRYLGKYSHMSMAAEKIRRRMARKASELSHDQEVTFRLCHFQEYKHGRTDVKRITRRTGLLHYLAGDKHLGTNSLKMTQSLLEEKYVDVDELLPRDATIPHTVICRERGPIETPLIEAVKTDWPAMVELLLEYGADPKATGHSGLTAFGHAVYHHRDLLMVLLAQQTGCEAMGQRPAMRDWWNGEHAVVRWSSQVIFENPGPYDGRRGRSGGVDCGLSVYFADEETLVETTSDDIGEGIGDTRSTSGWVDWEVPLSDAPSRAPDWDPADWTQPVRPSS